MAEPSVENKKKKLRNKLTDKYRFTLFNDNNYKEVFSMRLSRINVLAAIGAFGIIIVAGTYMLIAYTPLRQFIPGYPDGSMRQNILITAQKLDSLDYHLSLKEQYLRNIKTIISGGEPENYEQDIDTNRTYSNLDFSKSTEDSLFRQRVEAEDQFNFTIIDERPMQSGNLSNIHFFLPLKGIVTNSFNVIDGHFGTDIVAGPNEVVKATLDGTVILATWSLETGYTLQLQHANNLISVYKHNAELLKSQGAKVVAGEAIAIVGNSGELSTGPHLHFELWHNGKPINAEEYMVF